MCLCIDLILTLKDPFKPAKRRLKFYLAFSVIGCAPLAYLTKSSINNCNILNFWIKFIAYEKENVKPEEKELSNLVPATCLSIYMLVAIYSCVYATRRLNRWDKKETRKHFLRETLFIRSNIYIYLVLLSCKHLLSTFLPKLGWYWPQRNAMVSISLLSIKNHFYIGLNI
jgi:hypothetical protein